MGKLLLTVCLACVCWPAPALAQNPCTTPLTLALVTPTSAVVAVWAEYTAVFNGSPVFTDTDLAVFAKGAAPTTAIPVASISAPKANWVLVVGTTDCYRLPTTGAFLFGVTPNTEYDLYVRAKTLTDTGGWSQTPVPFGRKAAPAAPTGVRITP